MKKSKTALKYEDSPADKRNDKIQAEKRRVSLKYWKKSDEDERMDRAVQRKIDTKNKAKKKPKDT